MALQGAGDAFRKDGVGTVDDFKWQNQQIIVRGVCVCVRTLVTRPLRVVDVARTTWTKFGPLQHEIFNFRFWLRTACICADKYMFLWKRLARKVSFFLMNK